MTNRTTKTNGFYQLGEAIRNQAIYQFTVDRGFDEASIPAAYSSPKQFSILSGLHCSMASLLNIRVRREMADWRRRAA